MPSGNHDQCSVVEVCFPRVERRNGIGIVGDVDDGAAVLSVTFGLTAAGRLISQSGNVGGLSGLGTMRTVSGTGTMDGVCVGLLREDGGMGSSDSGAGMESPEDGMGAGAGGNFKVFQEDKMRRHRETKRDNMMRCHLTQRAGQDINAE